MPRLDRRPKSGRNLISGTTRVRDATRLVTWTGRVSRPPVHPLWHRARLGRPWPRACSSRSSRCDRFSDEPVDCGPVSELIVSRRVDRRARFASDSTHDESDDEIVAAVRQCPGDRQRPRGRQPVSPMNTSIIRCASAAACFRRSAGALGSSAPACDNVTERKTAPRRSSSWRLRVTNAMISRFVMTDMDRGGNVGCVYRVQSIGTGSSLTS